MKKVIRLNENDIEKLVNKIIKENERPRGGMMYNDLTDFIDEVINRAKQYGEEYIQKINQINSEYPSTKYKKINVTRNVELPKGVKVQSTVHPTKD